MHRTHAPAIGFTRSLPWIFMITGLYFISFFARSILSPLLVPMEVAFGASHAESAGLMFFFSMGFGTALALAGILSSRIRHRTVLLMAMGILGASLLIMARAEGLFIARLAFFLLGAGSGLYMPSGMATLASVADDRYWGRAISIHELAPNIAFILAPMVVNGAHGIWQWREILTAMGLICFLGAALFFMFGRGGNDYGTPPDPQTLPKMLRDPAFWAIMLFIGLGVGLESGPYSLTPLFLVSEKGMSATQANHLLSSSRLISPIMVILGGILADRVRISWILIVTILGSAVSLMGMGLLQGRGLGIAIMVQAAMPAVMFPAIFKSVTEIFGMQEQSLVLSLTMPVAIFVSLGVVPTLLGWCGDHGHFDYGFVAVGFLTIICLVALPFLKKRTSR